MNNEPDTLSLTVAGVMDERAAHADGLIQGVLIGEALANAGYVILVADEHMRYLAASEAACELLGYNLDELLGLTVSDIVVESDASERFGEFMRDRLQRGKITLRRKDSRHVVAAYDARETVVAGLPYYVSVLRPVDAT